MGLSTYRQKRDFSKTPEPDAAARRRKGSKAFVIQKHAARRLHYDFRLEMEGVLRSWAVPKGPSLNPADKRLAVETEDHPLAYGSFEGVIPEGAYGAGNVIIWDKGVWEPEGDAVAGYKKGRLKFKLTGEKLNGAWNLVRKAGEKGEKAAWFLIKSKDKAATDEDIVAEHPESVVSGKLVEQMDKAQPDVAKTIKKLNGVKKAASIPPFDTPLLPTLVHAVPKGEHWVHEIKYDGYRTIIVKNGTNVQGLTRKGLNWLPRYGDALARELKALPFKQLVLDAEVMVLNKAGVSDFAALQAELAKEKPQGLVMYVFDLLYVDGYDLRGVQQGDRKTALNALVRPLVGDGALHVSDGLEGNGSAVFVEACKQGLEGLISKNLDAVYEHGRSKAWLKVKCDNSGTFAVAGYSMEGKRGGLRSLVLAEQKENELIYVGRVGTGFNARNRPLLLQALQGLETERAPVKPPRGAKTKDITWVNPDILVEISYRNRTGDNLLRQASYKGLRPDKKDKMESKTMAATKEKKGKAVQPKKLLNESGLAEITITHPDRLLFGDEDVSKLDVALYTAKVANWLLPHVLQRPLSLIRCTSDNPESCFYQRHKMKGMPEGVETVKSNGKTYVYLDKPKALLALAQYGVVELHPWNCHVDDMEHPDQMVFDLDPDVGLGWEKVVDSALVTKNQLEKLGLKVFVKTTGGKGAHIVVPLYPQEEWDTVKAFAKEVAETLSTEHPKRFTASLSKAHRKGKVFIDYLRNGRSATAVAPYSLRARPGAPVAMPLSWEDFQKLKGPQKFTFDSVPRLLGKRKTEPWKDMPKAAKGNTKAMQAYLKKGRK